MTALAASHYHCHLFNLVTEDPNGSLGKEKIKLAESSPMLVLSQSVFCQMDSDGRSVQLIKIGVINDSSRLSGGLGVLSIPPNSHCSSVCWGRNLAHMHWVHLGLKVLWQHTAGQERSRNWAPSPGTLITIPGPPYTSIEPTISLPWGHPSPSLCCQFPSLGPSVITPRTPVLPPHFLPSLHSFRSGFHFTQPFGKLLQNVPKSFL